MIKDLGMRKSLFWDTDTPKLDIKQDADFIIGRVLDFGNLEEWKAVRDFYGIERIKKAAKRHIFFSPRDANFWAFALKIPLKNLKCTRKQSLKTPKAFLRR